MRLIWLRAKDDRFKLIYIAGLILFAAGLPLSKTLMTTALGVLAFHWIISKGFKYLPSYNSDRGKALLLFLMIFLIHIVGLIYTADFDYAAKDIRIKFPLLVLPIFIASAPKITNKQLIIVLKVFVAAVVISSLASVYNIFIKDIVDPREINPFLSHIRFGMMICFAVFAMGYMALKKSVPISNKILYALISAGLTFMLLVLEVLSGMILFLTILFFSFLYVAVINKKVYVRLTFILLIITSITALTIYFDKIRKEFHPKIDLVGENLPQYTQLGNPYIHDLESPVNENGNLVWVYVSIDELQKSWQKRSSYHFDHITETGGRIKDVLLRYLTSKGLKKDAEGVSQLTKEDISRIEQGVTNYRYGSWNGLQRRKDQLKWEYWNYIEGGNPKGHSFMQRLELWRAGWSLAKNNMLYGVGTGDIKNEFAKKLTEINSPLKETSLRAHNQYLTILITFGIPGLVLFIAGLAAPVIIMKRRVNYIFLIFLIICLMSMFIEDTLETQVGVSFFSLFYVLLIHSEIIDENKRKTENGRRNKIE